MMKVLLWLLPKRTLTALVGRYSRHHSSRKLIPWYIRHYRIDMQDIAGELEDYQSLADFFSRRLRQGARPLGEKGVISPVDGTISEFGQIKDGTLLQAKGCTYSLAALLTDTQDARVFEGGAYLTIYLSPRDYHRIHAPVSGIIRRWRFVPGRLFPVNRYGVAHVQGLFTKNERMMTWLETAYGMMAIVKVGATIVGSIQTAFGPSPVGPFHSERRQVSAGEQAIKVERGDEIGHFVFGSTVILLFPPDVIEQITVHEGDAVRMGQTVAMLAEQGM